MALSDYQRAQIFKGMQTNIEFPNGRKFPHADDFHFRQLRKNINILLQ